MDEGAVALMLVCGGVVDVGGVTEWYGILYIVFEDRSMKTALRRQQFYEDSYTNSYTKTAFLRLTKEE